MISQLIRFLKEVEKFKTCKRDCHTTDPKRAESDAEHSWHLALFLLLLENEFSDFDYLKIIKIALIHDLPEIYAGDSNPYRDNTDYKEEKERNAASELFSILPEKIKKELNSLFEEYLEQKTKEAKIVKSVDKLMPLVQNLCTNRVFSAYRDRKVEYDEAVNYMDPFFEDGIIKDIYKRLIDEAHSEGVFYREAEK